MGNPKPRNPYKWLVFSYIGIKALKLIAGHIKAKRLNKKKCAAHIIHQFGDL